MARLNPQACVGVDGDHMVITEDVSDLHGRMYRLEYQSSPDALKAIAYCRYNPWGTPGGNEPVTRSHCDGNGLLDLGVARTETPGQDRDLAKVVQRARYWCAAFSILKETGSFPQSW
jgi:hypothetical protein